MPALREWKRRAFPKGIRRALARYRNRLFARTTERGLTRSLEKLGLPDGSVICIHAKLSAFGHLVGGPEIVIRALRNAVPGCTVLMPTFPFGRTMVEYVDADPLFDPATTPSASGLLSEAFRRMEGVRRSIHPTHPCAALGPRADELIEGSEHAATPFGDDSSYGRYCMMENAFQLLLHTNSTSIVHRVQEIVGMPNLFLPEPRTVRGMGKNGAIETYRAVVHTPRIPLYVALPGGGGEVQYLWMPDYCVLFPTETRERTLERLRAEEARHLLAGRDDGFDRAGVFRRARHRRSEILAIEVRPWLEAICEEMRKILVRFESAYEPERVRASLRGGS